jgi:hypothetical protein
MCKFPISAGARLRQIGSIGPIGLRQALPVVREGIVGYRVVFSSTYLLCQNNCVKALCT